MTLYPSGTQGDKESIVCDSSHVAIPTEASFIQLKSDVRYTRFTFKMLLQEKSKIDCP